MAVRSAILMWALLVLLAGCGGSSEPEVVAPTTSSTTPTTTGPSITATLPPTTLAIATTTTTQPPLAPLPGGLHPLVEGHNDLAAQRINLVFVRHDVPGEIDWIELAREMLTWEGPVPLNQNLEPAAEGEVVVDLSYGPFSIEPFRSNRDLFNIWYYDESPPEPVTWGAARQPFPVELPNRVVVTLAWLWLKSGTAVPPTFVPPELPEPGSDAFVGLTMAIRSDEAHSVDATLAHELGHAVFGLADKYSYDYFGFDGRANWSFYPACATNQEEAEAFFGDLVGVVDPAFDRWLAERARYDLEFDEERQAELRDQITVQFVPNGCFGPEGVAIRSTEGGLMYSGDVLPVMGAVNRRWSEQVLDAWSGRAR